MMRNKHLNYGHAHIDLLTDLFAIGDQDDQVEIKNTQPANWITEQGVWKKQKALEPRMPSIRNARFVTVTVDPKKFDDSEHAFIIASRHLREFVYRLRKKVGHFEYCWKLEFGENGFPHWHFILLHYRPIDYRDIDKCWGKGRTNIQRISNETFSYLFKYAAKGVSNLPQYILDRKQVRFFQTSTGFLKPTEASPRLTKTEKEIVDEIRDMQDAYQRKESTLGERLDRWIRTLSISSNGFVGVTDYHGWSYADILLQAALVAYKILERRESLDVEITSHKIVTTKRKLVEIITI